MARTFRVDCHVHTSRHSACSSMSPDEACQAALARGLGALVLTEHHYRWTTAELDDLRRAHPGLALYPGVEMTLAEGHDVVVIGDALPLDLPHGCPFALLADALAPARHAFFAFVAHAFRWTDDINPEAEAVFRWADGLEMNSINVLRGAWRRKNGLLESSDAALYADAARDYGLLPLFNSDAHHVAAIGCIAGELPGTPPEDAAGLAALLRQSPQVQFQDIQRLSSFFY